MRELRQHVVEGDSANHQVEVWVQDEPGQGGACHEYSVSWEDKHGAIHNTLFSFQNGPIKDVGVNGLTHEALLAILIDRMESFQAGPYANARNQSALEHFRAGLGDLQARTRERIARGVEGTHAK